MKKLSPTRYFLLLTILLQLIFTMDVKAQEGWFWQNPNPQGNTLHGVSFSDDYNGTAVGSHGTIIRTTDGGNTWIRQESGTTNYLVEVSFADTNNGTAVGVNGIILNTKNGGQTWNVQLSGTTETLWGVSFSDANNGTAVGAMGTILRTTDGGSHWVAQSSSLADWSGTFLSVCFVDVNNGTIVGTNGNIQHTTDGGETWVAQVGGTTNHLWSVSFHNKDKGIAVGENGTILRTKDGGTNWIPVVNNSMNNITTNDLFCVSIMDDNHCFIGGETFSYWTQQWGQVWDTTVISIKVVDGVWENVGWSISFRIGNNDFLGVSNNTLVGVEGEIYHTSDNGTSWDAQKTGTTKRFKGVSFPSSDNGTVVGNNGTILHTTDGGSTWTPQSYDSPSQYSSYYENLKAVSFSDDNNGFVVCGSPYSDGSESNLRPGFILHTIDGGTTWNVPYDYTYGAFNGVSSPSANTCIAVGVYSMLENSERIDRPGYAYTTDGGVNWKERYWPSLSGPLTDVSFTSDDIGTVVGYEGRILRTINGTSNWLLQTSGTTKDLHGVCFTDENNGTVVGDDGTILRTSDGGRHWIDRGFSTDLDFFGVSFIDAYNGTIVGSNGIVLKTSDGVNFWSQVTTSENLYAIHKVDNNTGNIVGDNGTILRMIKGYPIVVSRNLYQGWSWFSLNVEGQDMSLGTVLNNIGIQPGDYIKSQTASATYFDDTGWFGELYDLSILETYKIKLSQKGKLLFEGQPVDLTTTSIPVSRGWNWIGYLPQFTLPISDALRSHNLMPNDYIKNQTESAIYYEGIGWFGELTDLQALDGFLIKAGQDGALSYSVSSPLANIDGDESFKMKYKSTPKDSLNPADFKHSGQVTAEVSTGGTIIGNKGDVLITLCEGRLVGKSNPIIFPPTGLPVFIHMTYENSEENRQLEFYFFDNSEKQWYRFEETLPFKIDMIEYDAFTPFKLEKAITVSNPLLPSHPDSQSLKVFPNPFKNNTTISFTLDKPEKVIIEIVDVYGKLVDVIDLGIQTIGQNQTIWDAKKLKHGVYFIRRQNYPFNSVRIVVL